MSRTVQLGVAAARLALDDARLGKGATNPDRFGVVYGTGTIPGELLDLAAPAAATFDRETGRIDMSRWGTEGMPLLPPMWLLNHVPNMTACHVSILNDARGPNNTITLSHLGSLMALGEAVRMIRRGSADVIIVGGADTRTDLLSLIRCSLFLNLSRRNAEPELALRPFDRDRDGTVLGEGAAALILEDIDHARQRGATILGEVVAFAAGFDAGCHGSGFARVIRQACAQASDSVAALDHVNARAPGTIPDDAWEARAIRGTVPQLPVVAYKANLSNLGAAADIAELILSLHAFRQGILPATRNHAHPAVDCPVTVCRQARPIQGQAVLKLGGTELGQCAAVIVHCGTSG